MSSQMASSYSQGRSDEVKNCKVYRELVTNLSFIPLRTQSELALMLLPLKEFTFRVSSPPRRHETYETQTLQSFRIQATALPHILMHP